MKKNTNPYAKKTKRRLRITRKQWIAIISGAVVIALIIGILVAGSLSKAAITDPHAGHNHGSELDDGHYEGDGHDHGTQSTANANAKVNYQLYTNTDKTYRLVIRDSKGAIAFEADKLTKAPILTPVDEGKGVYELGWATGQGPNDFECVYYNEKTGQVSQQFHAPRGTDGVRIAYPSADQKKIVVQDLFDKAAYSKEHTLENAYSRSGNAIVGGKLQADKKTVVVSYYVDKDGPTTHTVIKLYE